MSSKPPAENDNQWLPLWIILAGLVGWGIYHVIGAFRSGQDWQDGLTKGVIILGSFAFFLGIWAVALFARSRRRKS